jgi:hypothetical protein
MFIDFFGKGCEPNSTSLGQWFFDKDCKCQAFYLLIPSLFMYPRSEQ